MDTKHKMMIHLWFDTQAAEAAAFYQSVFDDTRLLSRRKLSGTPSGEVELLTLEIGDIALMLLSAGPEFRINPSISFMVSCRTKGEVRRYWDTLSDGGETMMPLDAYPFSELYGWVQDKFGVSWQLLYTGDAPVRARVKPSLLFVGDNAGRAEEAIGYYTGIFRNSEARMVSRYGEGFAPNKPEMLNYADFSLEGQSFSIMDSAYDHAFGFNEAVSILVNCDTQEEIDYYWGTLSAVPEAEQCGWIKDQFGVSWQISPTVMNDMLSDADPAALACVTRAFLQMKKFDIAALERAYRGE